jgi:hypothetical protein
MARKLKSFDNLALAIEELGELTAEEAKARRMPPPIIKPLKEFVELKGAAIPPATWLAS